MPGVQARLKEEHKRRYLDLDPKIWYQVVPIFPGVTQRMVNMAGERLARLATPRGFVTLRHGLTVPVEALLLALDLEQRGISLATDDNHQLVVPVDVRLTSDDRVAIQRWRYHLGAIVEYQAPEVG